MKFSKYSKLQEQNAVFLGWMFTEGNIENAGIESVAHIAIGEKFFINAERRAASRLLTEQTQRAKKNYGFDSLWAP